MTNTEAKFILAAYRANGGDAGDAAMADAVQQAKNDPLLRAWFQRAQGHDAAVAAKLREISPPAGLREAILAGGRASTGIRQARRPAWLRPTWLAAAAAILILAGGLGWWR